MFSPSLIAREVSIVAGEFEAIAPIVAQTAGVKDDVSGKVSAALEGLKETADAFATADETQAEDLIQRVVNDANAVLGAWLPLPLPGWAITSLRIAQVTLPTITAVARLVYPDLMNRPQAGQAGG